jgi:hypothetical protein
MPSHRLFLSNGIPIVSTCSQDRYSDNKFHCFPEHVFICETAFHDAQSRIDG